LSLQHFCIVIPSEARLLRSGRFRGAAFQPTRSLRPGWFRGTRNLLLPVVRSARLAGCDVAAVRCRSGSAKCRGTINRSGSQLDRLLDPQNVSVTLDTITRAARALGKRLIIRVADVKAKRA
jgi:hypothetical protein